MKSLTFFSPLPDRLVIIGSFLLLPPSPQLKSLKYYDQFFIRIYIFVQKWLTYVIMANSKGPGMYITFANVPATLLYYPNFYCKNPLLAIWWWADFWGPIMLLLVLLSSAGLGGALAKTAGRFPFRKLQKMHFLAVLLQWHFASFGPPASQRSRWFRALGSTALGHWQQAKRKK